MTEYALQAKLFHLLSLESRLRILDELRYGDACVCHLQHYLQKPQVYVSQQLRILKDAGLVQTHKEGVNVFYELVDPLTRTLLEQTLGPVEANREIDTQCSCPHCTSCA